MNQHRKHTSYTTHQLNMGLKIEDFRRNVAELIQKAILKLDEAVIKDLKRMDKLPICWT